MGGGPTHPGPVARVIPVRGLRPIDGDRPTDRSAVPPVHRGGQVSLPPAHSLPPKVSGPAGPRRRSRPPRKRPPSEQEHHPSSTPPTGPPPRHHGSSRHRAGPAGDAHRDHPSTRPPSPMRERTVRDEFRAGVSAVVHVLRVWPALRAGAEQQLLRRVPADTTAHRPATGVGACPWDEQGTRLRRGMETTVPTRAPAPAVVLRLRTHG